MFHDLLVALKSDTRIKGYKINDCFVLLLIKQLIIYGLNSKKIYKFDNIHKQEPAYN